MPCKVHFRLTGFVQLGEEPLVEQEALSSQLEQDSK